MSGCMLSQRYKDWLFIQGDEQESDTSGDLISRQAVNDAIEDWWISDDSDRLDLIKRLHERIDALPPVNPQEPMNRYCVSRDYLLSLANKDGAYGYVSAHAIINTPSVNPQEPKTIQEKQAESEKYDKAFDDGYENGYAQARFDYEQEPKTGHWVKTPKAVMGEGYMWYCDKCEHQVYQDSSRPYPSERYCPNCGAKMFEPQESEVEE